MLRPYQQAAHDAVVQHIRLSRDPCVVEAATGAGKSHIIAELAKTIHDISNGKSVLVLQPGEELVKQNHEKYEATGNRASIFSAAVGSISTRFPVVFGTPVSVKNKLSRFGDKFGLIIVDECHGITPTIIHIIDTIRSKNPNVRVVGLTATPYRLGTGYIYKIDENDKPVPDFQTKDPYFTKLVYRVTARYLLDLGYLTPVTIGQIGSGHYNTAELNGQSFKKDAVDRAYNGHGRLTSEIVADIVAKANNRKGVLLFCATVQHAKEAYASLPPEISAVVDGETDKDMRKSIVARFKAGKIKYLVSVGVFTTGFDAPHVDIVAMLRLTESPGLLQQIIGRGLRLCDDKTDCLFLDYAENIERHFPDGDVFAPEIRVGMSVGESQPIDCQCPLCDGENLFKARKNPDGYEIDKEGYFVDLRGLRIETDHGPIPAHSGRRCQCLIRDRKTGDYLQCGYRWTFKPCLVCGSEEDIAARYCRNGHEIIDPNRVLKLEFQAMKKDPTRPQTDEITVWAQTKTISRAGKPQWKIDIQTTYRSFTIWISSEPQSQFQWRGYELLMAATDGMKEKPRTITYKKATSGFYEALSYNRPHDVDPTS